MMKPQAALLLCFLAYTVYSAEESESQDTMYELDDGLLLTKDELLQMMGYREDSMGKRSMALGRYNFRPGKRSLALGRTKFRPGKRSLTLGRLGFRPAKRSLALGRNGFRPGKRSEMPPLFLY